MKTIFKLCILLLISISLSACTQAEEGEIVDCTITPEDESCVWEPISCAPGFKQEYDKCIEDTDYEEPKVCKAVNFVYDEENLTYNLIFSDEFDGTELDTEKWTATDSSYGGGNNELQYYTPNNITIEDGLLKITAQKESYNGREYTSSKIETRYKFKFTYGVVEIRAKQPAGRGTWSAGWMMPAISHYGGWPNSGEIDIFEYVGYDPLKTHSTIHTEIYYHKLGTQKGSAKNVENLDTEFHVYKVEWLPDRMSFYVDDELVFKYEPGKYQSCPGANQWPFDRDFYLILNLAIGGDWGGAQGIDDDIFPTTMEVDYVRVYQAEELVDIEQTEDPN